MFIYLNFESDIVSDTICNLLINLGHTSKSFKSTEELFTAMKTDFHQPDLIIMDKHASNRVMVEKICRHNQSGAKAPIVLATSTEGVLGSDEAILFGIRAYLRKPIVLSELTLMISQFATSLHQAG